MTVIHYTIVFERKRGLLQWPLLEPLQWELIAIANKPFGFWVQYFGKAEFLVSENFVHTYVTSSLPLHRRILRTQLPDLACTPCHSLGEHFWTLIHRRDEEFCYIRRDLNETLKISRRKTFKPRYSVKFQRNLLSWWWVH